MLHVSACLATIRLSNHKILWRSVTATVIFSDVLWCYSWPWRWDLYIIQYMFLMKGIFKYTKMLRCKISVRSTAVELCVSDSWWMTNVMHKFSSMCLFLFATLYMFRAHSAHHQERQIVSIQPLVTDILCWWPRCVQVRRKVFLISSFRRVQNVVCFLLGDSPASDLYMPTFRNTLSVPSSKAGVKSSSNLHTSRPPT